MAAMEPSSIAFDTSDSDAVVLLKSLALQFAFKGEVYDLLIKELEHCIDHLLQLVNSRH